MKACVICKHKCYASNFTTTNNSKITAATSLWITAAVLCFVAFLALLTVILCKQQRCRKKVVVENLRQVEARAINEEDADGNSIAGSKSLLPTNRQYEKELEDVEQQINDRKLSASRLVGTHYDTACQICQKTKFADGVGNKCYCCQLRCCVRCGGRLHIKTKVVLACALCQKRQQIINKTSKWLIKNIYGPTTSANQSLSNISMPTSCGSGSLAAEPPPPSAFQQGCSAPNKNQPPAPPSKTRYMPTCDHQSPQGKPQPTQRMSKHQTEAVQKHSQRQQALQQHISTDVCMEKSNATLTKC